MAAQETDLYAPVKSFLEGQGYEVKSEIGSIDVMAWRDGEDPVLVELKNGFSLKLVHQGIAGQAVSDWVYLAVPRPTGKAARKALRANAGLCRRLGLGLITVRQRDGFIEVLVDPGAYRPRKSPVRKGRLLREFQRRVGDPNMGGATRVKLVTAYRQDALRCAGFLAAHGATKGATVAQSTGVGRATLIMANDHYGWFERVSTGIYQLTPKGADEMTQFPALDETGKA